MIVDTVKKRCDHIASLIPVFTMRYQRDVCIFFFLVRAFLFFLCYGAGVFFPSEQKNMHFGAVTSVSPSLASKKD